jgi:hypothetical protein
MRDYADHFILSYNVTESYLKRKVKSHAFTLKSREAALHDLAKEIKKLRHKLSKQEKKLFKLCMKGMYAFCV